MDHTSAQTSPETDRHQGGLQRGLTSRQISMIGLSGALGTGLFMGSASMIKIAGPGIIASYTLTGLLALIVVWALTEITVQHPVAGGFGAAAGSYVGPFGGFLARWNVGIVMCIAVGVEVTAVASYLQYWWPGLDLFAGTVLASAVLVVLNLATVKLYGVSEYWFSMIKVVVVVAFILLGLWLLFVGLPGRPAPGLRHLWADGGFAPHGLGGILAAAVLAVFSFGGAENVALTAAESADPVRDIPRASRAMILRLVVFYVGAIAVVVALAPWNAEPAGSGIAASPFVQVLSTVGINGAASFMNFILIVAALSAGNGCLYASSRMFHSLGHDRLAPAALATTSDDGAPRNAVLAASLGMVVAALLALLRPDDAFAILFGVLIFGLWLTWMLIMVTYLAFRAKRAKLGLPASPAQVWGGTVTGWIGLGLLVSVGIGMFFIDSIAIAWAVGAPYVIVLGLLYLVFRKGHAAHGVPNLVEQELAAGGVELPGPVVAAV